ncbi:MAG: flagellar regulator YcgR PilZN domain-containing protein [Pseudohongiella sp.]|uniref:flagellar brake protein n=1 Tax=Pseudohongiella sp. TaxID=1979412 RepID=UPI0034A0ADF4
MATISNNERYYTSAGDIFSVLRTLQSDRSSISIQFNGNGAMYSSLVLDVSLKNRTFQLDEFTPREAHRQAEAGTPFSMRASISGIRVHAKDLVVERVMKDDDGLYYQMKFPERLLYLQRRDAFRAWVPGTLMVASTCTNKNHPKGIQGRVQNMSATGFRLIVEGKVNPPPSMLEEFDLVMKLPLIDHEFACPAEAVYVQYQQDQNQTMLGFRFGNMGRGDQIAVNRFVTQLQRESIA